jgi:deazaflavin-dependent oxidoreductase (nitroreductase family)
VRVEVRGQVLGVGARAVDVGRRAATEERRAEQVQPGGVADHAPVVAEPACPVEHRGQAYHTVSMTAIAELIASAMLRDPIIHSRPSIARHRRVMRSRITKMVRYRSNSDRGDEMSTSQERVPPRWALKLLARMHVRLNRLSGGRIGNRTQGADVCFVTMTGAKSGRVLTKPLIHVPYREGVLLVASLGGSPTNPVWYHNLVAHPDVEVRHRRRTTELCARLATAAETPDLWPICDASFPPYADYRARTSRTIPIFICEPRSAPQAASSD